MSKNLPTECPNFASTAKIVGDFWTLAIIDRLQHGSLRFCELQKSIAHSTPVTLTARLKKLEAAKLISRTCGINDRQSVCYELTPSGRECITIIAAIHSVAKCV